MSEYITTYTGLHFRPTEPDSGFGKMVTTVESY